MLQCIHTPRGVERDRDDLLQWPVAVGCLDAISDFKRYLFISMNSKEIKWNELGCRSPLCTYRLHWARITCWGWWDEWHGTTPQTHESKFEPWRPAPYLSVAEAPHNIKKIFTSERGRKNVFLWNVKTRVGFESVISDFPSRHLYPLHQGPRPMSQTTREMWNISLLHPRSKSLQEPSERAHGHSWAPNIHSPVRRKKTAFKKLKSWRSLCRDAETVQDFRGAH